MFIHIKQAKSPATINLIFKEMKEQEREFLPEDMLDHLKGTNHHLIIRDMLKNIPEGKEADFKEAICSAVEHREYTEANLERMREIAKIGGFEDEFEEAHAKDKWIGDTYKRTFIAKSNEDLRANPDLSGYGTVICDFEGDTEFADLTKLPKRMIIKGNINWRYRDFEKLPDISESIVYGNFDCSECRWLESLEGAPKEVGGDFYCSGCENLTSLVGAPEKVGRDYYCCKTNITSLEGAPKEVGGSFNCSLCDKLEESGIYLVQDGRYYDVFNLPKDKEFVINGDLDLSIYDFKRLPDLSNVVVKGDFACDHCSNLTSLVGAPKEVGGSFDCSRCDKLEESGIYLVQDGKYYDVFNLPKDKEFVINGSLNLS